MAMSGRVRLLWRGRVAVVAAALTTMATLAASGVGVGLGVPAAAGSEAEGPAGGRGRRAVDLVGVSSVALDVNDHGVVVGWYVPSGTGDVRHAFRRSPGGRVTDLGPGTANAVNDAGVVVGERTDAEGFTRATLWDARGRAHDLGLPGYATATDVNDRGAVVGYAQVLDAVLRPFLIEPGAAPELLDDPAEVPGGDSGAVALNERGDIVGFAYDDVTNWPRPILWEGTDHRPTLLPGRRDNYDVTGINERGTIVGSTSDDAGYQAVVWTGRHHREVDVGEPGVHSLGRDVNDAGQVVGVRYNAGDAFLWDPRTGRTTILTGLTDVRDEALAINDRGAVVGYSTEPTGEVRATLFAHR